MEKTIKSNNVSNEAATRAANYQFAANVADKITFCQNTACCELQDLNNPVVVNRRKEVQRRLFAKLNEATRAARNYSPIPNERANDALTRYYRAQGVKVGEYLYYSELVQLGRVPSAKAQPLLFWGAKNSNGYFNIIQKFRPCDCVSVYDTTTALLDEQPSEPASKPASKPASRRRKSKKDISTAPDIQPTAAQQEEVADMMSERREIEGPQNLPF